MGHFNKRSVTWIIVPTKGLLVEKHLYNWCPLFLLDAKIEALGSVSS